MKQMLNETEKVFVEMELTFLVKATDELENKFNEVLDSVREK